MAVTGSLGLLSATLGLQYEVCNRQEGSRLLMMMRLYMGTLIPMSISLFVFRNSKLSLSTFSSQMGQWEKFFAILYVIWQAVYFRGLAEVLLERNDQRFAGEPSLVAIFTNRKSICWLLLFIQSSFFYFDEFQFTSVCCAGPLLIVLILAHTLEGPLWSEIVLRLSWLWRCLDTFWL